MNVEKRVIGHLTKCYCLAPLRYKGKDHFIVAAEKDDACLLYDTEGNFEETIWEKPGGVMSIAQVPGTDGQFLSTRKFYSPNDSKNARIDLVTPRQNCGKDWTGVQDGTKKQESTEWQVRTLTELPFVHRFGLLSRNGHVYLLACALKSGHEYKEDWSSPGAVYGAELSDLSAAPDLQLLKGNMLKNHGYTEYVDGGVQTAVISCDSGVYQFIPPETPDHPWEIKTLIQDAASDGVLVDLDGDGETELAVMSPFHGERFRIYKKYGGKKAGENDDDKAEKNGAENGGMYKLVFEDSDSMEFLHAIYGGTFNGKAVVMVGHRKGKRNLVAYTYNKKKACYEKQIIDEDCGAANILKIKNGAGEDVLIAANREIDEIAYYRITDI